MAGLGLVFGLGLGLGADPVVAGPALVMDADSGQVIYEEEATRAWQPASLTKLMTAYVVFTALKEGRYALNTEIGITPRAFAQPPTRFGLGIGKTVSIELALHGLIIKSANDLAVALAEATSGSEAEFVAEMNATAARLGMTRTHFINPNGLPALIQVAVAAPEAEPPADAQPQKTGKEQAGKDKAGKADAPPPGPIFHSAPPADQARTSARDMGLLARALHRDFPEYFPMFSEAEVEIGKRRAATHNELLKGFEGADGMKTGFTCGAGYNIVASASRGGRRIIAVVLGEQTGAARTARVEHLIDHGFEVVGWKLIFEGPTVGSMAVAEDEPTPPDMASKQWVAKCGGRPDRAAGATLRSVKARAARRVAKK